MFKSTSEFFEEVTEGHVNQLDIINYIESITDNHNVDKLNALSLDLDLHIFDLEGFLYNTLTKEEEENMIEEYKKSGKELPYTEVPNHKFLWKKSDGIKDENQPKTIRILNKEEVFYPYELIHIKQLNDHIRELISERTNQEKNPKHNHIFANYGFLLFEHIMENHIEPFDRGWKTKLSFYYWKMLEDNYIHQRPEKFKKWFIEEFQNGNNEVHQIDKMKTLSQVNNYDRLRNYSRALDWFKQQNK